MFLAGAIFLVVIFVIISVIASRNIKSSEDYSVAGRSATISGVSGIIMGALVGGASTVGTVQMAYEWGLSAWWFTLGPGIGCLILGVWFAKPLRDSGLVTIPAFLKVHYGKSLSQVSMLSSSVGTFISIIAQFLAGVALFRGVFPLGLFQASLIFGILVLGFIYLGGLKSYSQIGKAKIATLYLTLFICSLFAVLGGSTPVGLLQDLPFNPYFNIFGRGISSDVGALISMIVGVFCTQIYIQGIYAASDSRTARKGVILASFLMPPLGLMGIYIGLSMKYAGVQINTSQALPYFIIHTFPAPVAGILWAGILITVIGAAAGPSLGISTNIVMDLFFHSPLAIDEASEFKILIVSRITVAFIVVSAAYVGTILNGSMILHWSFLSMGLRGVGTFFPLIVAILWPGSLPGNWALISVISGISVLFAVPFSGNETLHPLFTGLITSGAFVIAGSIHSKQNRNNLNRNSRR